MTLYLIVEVFRNVLVPPPPNTVRVVLVGAIFVLIAIPLLFENYPHGRGRTSLLMVISAMQKLFRTP